MKLVLTGLRIAVPGRTLVEALDLTLAPGECWALLGRNGAGKSLLIETLAGLRAPASGRVQLDDRPLADWPRRRLATALGVLPQEESADFWGSLTDYVALGSYPRGAIDPATQAVSAAIDRLELGPFARAPFRTLSGGERQRARLAQILVQDPAIWLLDEPLNHLDLRHQRLVLGLMRTLAGAGRTVLASLHDPALAQAHCSHALLVYHSGRSEVGRIESDPSSDDAARVLSAETVNRLYGLDGPPAGQLPDSNRR